MMMTGIVDPPAGKVWNSSRSLGMCTSVMTCRTAAAPLHFASSAAGLNRLYLAVILAAAPANRVTAPAVADNMISSSSLGIRFHPDPPAAA